MLTETDKIIVETLPINHKHLLHEVSVCGSGETPAGYVTIQLQTESLCDT